MATENFEMPFFYFLPNVQKVCLYSSQSWHIIGYDLIFIALDIFIHYLYFMTHALYLLDGLAVIYQQNIQYPH